MLVAERMGRKRYENYSQSFAFHRVTGGLDAAAREFDSEKSNFPEISATIKALVQSFEPGKAEEEEVWALNITYICEY